METTARHLNKSEPSRRSVFKQAGIILGTGVGIALLGERSAGASTTKTTCCKSTCAGSPSGFRAYTCTSQCFGGSQCNCLANSNFVPCFSYPCG